MVTRIQSNPIQSKSKSNELAGLVLGAKDHNESARRRQVGTRAGIGRRARPTYHEVQRKQALSARHSDQRVCPLKGEPEAGELAIFGDPRVRSDTVLQQRAEARPLGCDSYNL